MASLTVLLFTPRDPGWAAHKAALPPLPAGVRMVAEVATLAEACATIPELEPDLVFWAARSEGLPTLPALAALLPRTPRTRFLLIAEQFESGDCRDGERLGLAGYLLRDAIDADLVLQCLAAPLASAGYLLSRGVAQALATGGRPLRVVLVDTSDLAGVGLETLLASDPRFDLVAVSDRIGETGALAQRLTPGLIVIDPQRRGQLDLDLIDGIAAMAPQSHLCVYTSIFEPRCYFDAMLRGALGYVLKGGMRGEQVLEALLSVGRTGGAFVDPGILRHFRENAAAKVTLSMPESDGPALTPRQREVATLVAHGLSDPDIATRLTISQRTVEFHVTALRDKFKVDKRSELIAALIEHGHG